MVDKINLYILFLIFFIACKEPVVIVGENQVLEETIVAEFTFDFGNDESNEVIIDKEEVVEKTPSIDTIITNLVAKSPFKDLGCCNRPEKRIEGQCCCNLVIEKYKEILLEGNSGKIVDLRQNDPIFSDCYSSSQYALDFEKAENPNFEAEEEEEDPEGF